MPIYRLAGVLLLLTISPHSYAQTCSYNTWRWNVQSKQTTEQERVVHPYDELVTEERDAASECTVCEEDQEKISVDGLPEFYVCKFIAPQVRRAFAEFQRLGAPIKSVVAYRVGRSRGKVDANGNRSEFSNHSFGLALDINAEHNGLYNQCPTFGLQCVLSRGGKWEPGIDPYSISGTGEIVRILKANGFKWGGEIAGQQKDFMHFSPTGY
jgi:hypothetical protein